MAKRRSPNVLASSLSEEVDIDKNNKLWLMSYSDVITLLLVFFIMLLGNSGVSNTKIEAIASSLKGAGLEETSIKKLSKDIKKMLKEKKLEHLVYIEENLEGINVQIKNELLFSSGEATLTARNKSRITPIVSLFRGLPPGYRFEIEGHTDDVPIKKKEIPSNWYLSSYRALSILDVFLQLGFKPNRFAVQGFADTKPIVPNRTKKGKAIPANQAKNRRVVIKIR